MSTRRKKTFTEVKLILSRLLEELNRLSPGQFITPYRGYIINLNAVRTLMPKRIEMENGSEIIIKAGDYRKIKEILFNYSFIETGGSER